MKKKKSKKVDVENKTTPLSTDSFKPKTKSGSIALSTFIGPSPIEVGPKLKDLPTEDIGNSIFFGLEKDEYHGPVGLSSSGAKCFYELPNKYQTEYLAESEIKKPKHFTLGDLVHCRILESEQFSKRYFRFEGGKRTGKNWLEDCAKNPKKTGILKTDWDKSFEMAESVKRHPGAMNLLNRKGYSEIALFWRDKTIDPVTNKPTDLLLKTQIDRLILDDSYLHGAIVDIKSSASEGIDGFAKAKHDFKYWLSAAFYLYGVKEIYGISSDLFIFIVVESKAPHRVRVEYASKEEIELGRMMLKDLFPYFKHCKENNIWPSYPGSIIPGTMHNSDKYLFKKYLNGFNKFNFDTEKKEWIA